MPRSPLLLTVIVSLILLPVLVLTACADSHEVFGQAYVAPNTLRVRSDLSLKSKIVIELKHGDRVGIIDLQRRMMKIRTSRGLEGWVDSQDLLSPDQMKQLRQTRQQQAQLPVQAYATAYEMLNIHIDPSRKSPAFAQIPEGGSVAVLGHRVAEKNAAPSRAPGLKVERPSAPSRKQRKEQQNRGSFRLPPKPPPPKPPANWQELSAERIDGAESLKDLKADKDKQFQKDNATPKTEQKIPAEAKKPPVLEDWTLVRTKANEIGWVLTRNLLMSIPDEVAQYAEGRHITAFFDLGIVKDEVKGIKHDWLWTTGASLLPYDFDSWRVFLWNSRRHRYETSHRQRDLEGYFPVEVERPDPNSRVSNFQIVTKDDDGKMRRRSYRFDGTLVRLTGTEDYQPGSASGNKAGGIDTNKLQSKLPKGGWLRRQWTALKQRVSGN